MSARLRRFTLHDRVTQEQPGPDPKGGWGKLDPACSSVTKAASRCNERNCLETNRHQRTLSRLRELPLFSYQQPNPSIINHLRVALLIVKTFQFYLFDSDSTLNKPES
jgi:hypothetical protein